MKLRYPNESIKRMQDRRKALMNKIKCLRELKKIEFGCTITWSGEYFVCHILEYSDLHETRSALRNALGSWNDELTRIMPWKNSEKKFMVEYTWQGNIPQFPDERIIIMLDIEFEKIPDELKHIHEGCSFEFSVSETEATKETVLKYICKKDQ